MKTRSLVFTIFGVLLLSFILTSCSRYTTGKVYHGFELEKKAFVKEVNAECYYFVHQKSGARLLKIAADDPNKTFSIAFKTIPNSDGGTPHILEHSVLNGSKNFPVKSPFDVLRKGSLNTFLNAFTGNDFTMYPIASMNNKDYFNLMHVYLDAVFNPLVLEDKRIFEQEGWHYEAEDADAPVRYNGVVYNEMKGSFSNPARELDYNIYKTLFPENGYHFESGGYPMAIPKLTYEQFIKFYQRYYHPSSSYIFLYGDADLDRELEFIDANYLSHYDKLDVNAEIPIQKPFPEMKKIHANYSVTAGSDTKNQTYLNLSFVAGKNTDRSLVMALDILSDVLVNQESAPVRLALQDAGIGREVSAVVDPTQQNIFEITTQNANPKDSEKFREVVFATLQEVADTGVDSLAVAGTLNRMEFSLREGDDAQKGLNYGFNALSGWFFADDPFLSLAYEKPLAELKSGIKQGYLENVIQRYLINNPHALLLTLEQKPGLEKINNQKITEELAEYRTSLSKDQFSQLVQHTAELKEYQKREDSPEALATIPMLSLEDIDPKAEWASLEEKSVSGVPVLAHQEFTNDVVYARLYFDLRVLPDSLVPYAALLSQLLGNMNTENYSYGDLENALNINTGGFNTSLNSYAEYTDSGDLVSKFVVSSKAMRDKVPVMFDLMSEIITRTKLEDTTRLRELLTRHQSRLEVSVNSNGYGYAARRLLSYFSREGRFSEETRGITYYRFITDLTKNFDARSDEIVRRMAQVSNLIFTKENCVAAVTSAKGDLATYLDGLKAFAETLPAGAPEYHEWAFQPEKKNEGFLTASKVQYVLAGYDYKSLGYDWNGKMLVLSQILSSEWLQNQVRVIGGAYGSWAAFMPSGEGYFASYRDPNLSETLDNYRKTVDYLDNFDVDDKAMTRFIIGTVASLDQPRTPSGRGDEAVSRYFKKITKQDVQKVRDEVLATTPEDIRNMSKFVADLLAENTICVYGNEDKLNAEKNLFNKVVTLNQ